MICWSCEKNAGAEMLCSACGAIQPPDVKVDHFFVLGAERRFDLDLGVLESRYKDLVRVLHPDRFARADARARRASLQRSVQLNEAWRTLREPVRRAEYLLSLHGVEVAGEKTRVPVAPELLMEVMELREGLADARAGSDHARVEVLASEVKTRRDLAMAVVAAGFARGQSAWDDVAKALVSVRYYDRFLEEVAVHDEARAEVSHGG